MARNHATLYTTLWEVDSPFRELTSGAQWAYMTMLSQPTLSLVGVLRIDWKNWPRLAVDGNQDAISAALDELEDHAYVASDHDTDEVWIRSFMYHDRVFRQAQVTIAAASAYSAVLSPRLRGLIHASVPPGLRERFPDGLRGAKRDEVKKLIDECRASEWKPSPLLRPVENPRRVSPSVRGNTSPSTSPNSRGAGVSDSPLTPPLALGLGGVGVGGGGGVGPGYTLHASEKHPSETRTRGGGSVEPEGFEMNAERWA